MTMITRFNPRPRAGGDYRVTTAGDASALFQSTPPRGGRHDRVVGLDLGMPVSIHAPARGATKILLQAKEGV